MCDNISSPGPKGPGELTMKTNLPSINRGNDISSYLSNHLQNIKDWAGGGVGVGGVFKYQVRNWDINKQLTPDGVLAGFCKFAGREAKFL